MGKIYRNDLTLFCDFDGNLMSTCTYNIIVEHRELLYFLKYEA